MSENKPDSSTSIKNVSKEQPSQLRRPTLGTSAATKISQENRLDSVSRSSTSSRDHGTILTADTEQFIIGQKIWVGGISPGQIAYIGETHFAPGEWAGIVLDEPNGKNDGCVAGKRYFQCEAKKGIFSRLTRLTLHPLENAAPRPAQTYSPDRSRTVSPTPSTQSVLNRSMGGRNGFTLGDRVIVSSGFGSRLGTLRFIGETQFASGNWCGIELDDSTGKNDGSVEGVKYFECKPKYGIFVPIAKVSLSPKSKKSRLSRAGSRESLTSVGTMNSIATTNTSRLRMQRYSNSLKQPTPSTTKSSFSMQDLLREKQNHIEQLMIERDMDQEDAQNQALQFQKIILELKSKIDTLEKNLEEEKNKTEDLQLSIEEANFCGDELNVQTQVYKEKITDLEQRLRAVTSGSGDEFPIDPVKDEAIVKKEITPTVESKYDIQQHNNQYSYNQNENPKRDSLDDIKALNGFRELLRKAKDYNSSETTYQEELNRYIKDPDEILRIHSIKMPFNQTSDRFLNDLFESLALAINELNFMSIENKNISIKCMNFEDTLKNYIKDIARIEDNKSELSKNLEDLRTVCKNLSDENDKIIIENKALEVTVKRSEDEKNVITEKLQDVSSNCEKFVGLNEQLRTEIKLQQEKTEQIEKEKIKVSQELEDVLSNCKSLSEINKKMQAELKTNAEKSNLLEGEQSEVSRKIEEINLKCRTLSEQNENLLKNFQASEDKLHILETQKSDIEVKNLELLTKLKNSSELNEKIQQQLQVSEENSFKFKEEIEDLYKKLSEMSTNYKILSDVNDQLKADIKTNAEMLKNMDENSIEVLKKLEETKLNCKSYEQINEKLQEELTTSEAKSCQIEAEKLSILKNLEELKTNYKSLSDLNEKMKEEIIASEQKSNLLEDEKCKLSQKLDEKIESCSKLSELNNKLQAELVIQDEKLKSVETQKLNISNNLESLSDQIESLKLDLKTSRENFNSLETEKLDISKKLEEVQLTLRATLEQNENLQHNIKTIEENSNYIEKEKFELSRKFEEVSLNLNNLKLQNEKHQNDIKTNEEKLKILEETNVNISLMLKDAQSNYEILSDVKNKLQQELLSKNEGNTSFCNNLMQQNEKLQQEMRSVEEQNKNLVLEKSNILQKSNVLEDEKCILSQKLDEKMESCNKLSELNDKLQAKLIIQDEKLKAVETQKLNISNILEETKVKFESLSEQIESLKLELNTSRENSNSLETEKLDISKKLEEVQLTLRATLEQNENLQHNIKTIEENSNYIEKEKFELSRKFEEVSLNLNNLKLQNEKHQNDIKTNEEKLKILEETNVNISLMLKDAQSNYEILSDAKNKLEQELLSKNEDNTSFCNNLMQQNEKLQQEMRSIEEQNKELELEKSNILQNLEKVTLKNISEANEHQRQLLVNCEKLENINEKLQQDLKLLNDKFKESELKKTEISQQLNEVTTGYSSLNEDFVKLKEVLKNNEEKTNQLATEKIDISGNLIDATLQIANLSDLSENLQQKYNITEEKCKQLELEKLEIIEKLKKNSELNNELEQKLNTFEEKTNKLEAEKLEISGNLVDAALECENLSELNKTLQQQLKDKEEKCIKPELQKSSEGLNEATNMQLKLEAYEEKDIKVRKENFELSENLDKPPSSCQTSHNVHNEFIIGRLQFGNQLQDIYQLINSIKSYIENLDQHIQSIPSIRTDKLNAAEEKSCELQYDFIELQRRFESLLMINEKYPSLKDSISKSLLDEAKRNIKEQEACMEYDPSDEIQLLQNICISYQLVLKANDLETVSYLNASLDPSGKGLDESVLKNLKSDLELTRSFIIKLDELNFILKRLRYFQLKISKYNSKVNVNFNSLKNDKSSLEDICKVTLQLRDAEKKLKDECSELIKLLINSMETFEDSKPSLNKSTTTKTQVKSTVPISHIDKSIQIINNVMNSNSILLNMLCEKVEIFEEKNTFANRNLLTENSKLDVNTKTELKTENMDEKTAQINFLHSIISDMQQKNDKLKDKIETLEAFSTDSKKSYMYEMIAERKPAPRMFCDICDQFDLHETEDCPLQESDGATISFQPVERVEDETNEKNLKNIPEARKYCENCEVFGDHETEDCYAGLE